jgi:hypothetical protein
MRSMFRKTRKKNKKERKTRKKNKKEKHYQHGGALSEYIPDFPKRGTMETTMLKAVILEVFQNLRLIGISNPRIPGPVTYPSGPGCKILYLAGYDEFIAPHSLIPLYKDDGSLSGPKGYNDRHDRLQLSSQRPTNIDQVYYYLTPFVHDNFIIKYKLVGGEIRQPWPQSHLYVGYNGLKPVVTHKDESFIVNEHLNYGDKFLFFPSLTNYIEFDFIPNEHVNDIYTVPDIGDVILKQPADNQPWYGKKIKIIFEPGYVAPEIVSQLSEYGPEIPIDSFLTAGKELNDM